MNAFNAVVSLCQNLNVPSLLAGPNSRFVSLLDDTILDELSKAMVNDLNADLPVPNDPPNTNPRMDLDAQIYYAKKSLTNYLLVIRAAARGEWKKMGFSESQFELINEFCTTHNVKL
jgi:hypothetical protein